MDHIGYAVKDIERAKVLMETLGFIFEKTIEDKVRNVVISFGEMDGYRIELVASMNNGSPVDAYISKTGPIPYHICFRSTEIEKDIEELKKKRFKVVSPLAPAVAFDGKKVVFLYSLTVGLIELVEK